MRLPGGSARLRRSARAVPDGAPRCALAGPRHRTAPGAPRPCPYAHPRIEFRLDKKRPVPPRPGGPVSAGEPGAVSVPSERRSTNSRDAAASVPTVAPSAGAPGTPSSSAPRRACACARLHRDAAVAERPRRARPVQRRTARSCPDRVTTCAASRSTHRSSASSHGSGRRRAARGSPTTTARRSPGRPRRARMGSRNRDPTRRQDRQHRTTLAAASARRGPQREPSHDL